MGGSLSGGKSQSKSEPVTYRELMHPAQIRALGQTGPLFTARGMEGLGGIGLTPQQREGQMGRLSDLVSSRTGAHTMGLNRRAARQGLTGGALEEARAGISAGGLSQMAMGLRGIEDMNMQLAQQKIADLLGWMMRPLAQGQRSESKGWQAAISGGMAAPSTSTSGGSSTGGGSE
jgi:hypothetical protein